VSVNLPLPIDSIPVLAWSANTDGRADFLNAHYLQYIGMSAEQALGWGSIVERHHGTIWAAPNEDVGATFAFEIPSQPPAFI
jgi:hypothetical protein